MNSLRRRLPAVLDWLKRHAPDILCLQETKVQDPDFPLAPLRDAGYHVAYRGMKTFNGVATLTRNSPTEIEFGLEPGPDGDPWRLVRVQVDGITVINTYVPQGMAVGSPKYAYKLAWLDRLRRYFDARLVPDQSILWMGDVNVAPNPLDVFDPVNLADDPCFHVDARAAYERAVSFGFVDVFRRLHPERRQFTYWDFFRNSFARDRGWRIDHILATTPLANQCTVAEVDMEPRRGEAPSDHTIVWAEFQLSSSPQQQNGTKGVAA